jgi:hypothetical protein
VHYADLIFVGGAICAVAGLWSAALRLNNLDEPGGPAQAFERTYTTVGAHVAEFCFFAAHGAWRAASSETARRPHLARALYSCALAALTLLVPLAALDAAGAPSLAEHGIALGLGALAWSYFLESASLPERTQRLCRRVVLRLPLWMWAILLGLSDVTVLLLTAYLPNPGDSTRAGLVGASYVALADLVSMYLGFLLAPRRPYPLSEPFPGT